MTKYTNLICVQTVADKWGFVYLCGQTNSTTNIATVGAHADTFQGGGNDAFLSKWSSDGALLWATYYGGTNVDLARGVTCDTLGHVYIGGNTNSASGIVTTGAFQSTIGVLNDAFIVKFDSSGTRLWATYFGGAGNDASTSMGITIDKSNNLLLTANTQSNNLPTTAGVHQATIGGSHDAFIANFNSTGSLNWCTYYGGTAADYPYGIATDDSDFIYISGFTQSVGGIATTGAYQATNAGGQDAFVAKFTNTGERVWGTYFGGIGIDQSRAIATVLDKVIISGSTNSTSGLTDGSSFQQFYGGGNEDGFIAAFSSTGGLDWSTYYGGLLVDNLGRGICVNSENDIYLIGETLSTDNIASPGSLNELFIGAYDLCLVKFNAQGQRIWGTYLGGTNSEIEGRVTVGLNSKLYLTGRTTSASGIATNNAHQSVFNGGDNDAFLLCINDCAKPQQPGSINGVFQVCSGTTHSYSVAQDTLGAVHQWILPGSWQGQSDSSGIYISFGSQSDTLKLVAMNACGGVSDTQYVYIEVLPAPQPAIVANGFVLSTTQAFASYQWLLNGNAIAGATQATHIATEDGSYAVIATNAEGCNDTSNSLVVTGTISVHEKYNEMSLVLYPNPAKTSVWITATQSYTARLLTVDGRTVRENIQLKKGITELSLENIPSGVYFLHCTDKVFKIVKD